MAQFTGWMPSPPLASYKMGVVMVPILSTLHMGPRAMETTREGFRY